MPILIPRKEVFARTFRFLTLPRIESHLKDIHLNCDAPSYNEECYLISINVDVNKENDKILTNAVVPCSCNIDHTQGHSIVCDNSCDGIKFINNLVSQEDSFIGIKDSGCFIHHHKSSTNDADLPESNKGYYALYRHETMCKKFTNSPTASGNSNLTGASFISKMCMDEEEAEGSKGHIEYFLKSLIPLLKPLSYHTTPDSEAEMTICQMTLDGPNDDNEDEMKANADDVYIVWYKGEAKFFTNNIKPDPINTSGVLKPYVDLIREGYDPRVMKEYSNEVVRGMVPFDRNSPLACIVTKWNFSDYIQHINFQAKSLLEKMRANLVCATDYLKFKFIWIEHSFSLCCFVYLKQKLESQQCGSCIICNVWQPSILTPATINILFKNAIISLASHLKYKPTKAVDDYYIYKGSSLNVNTLAGIGQLGSNHPFLNYARMSILQNRVKSNNNFNNISQIDSNADLDLSPTERSLKDNVKTDVSSLTDSPNYGFQNLSEIYSDVQDHPLTPKCNNENGSDQIQVKTEEPDLTLNPDKDNSDSCNNNVCTPTAPIAMLGNESDSTSPNEKDNSSTRYASSQSFDKSMSDLSLSTTTCASEALLPSEQPSPTGTKCYCISCAQFRTLIIPLLDKEGVMSYGSNTDVTELLFNFFSSRASTIVDCSFFETKPENEIEVAEELPAKVRSRVVKVKNHSSRKLFNLVSQTSKSLKDALKLCDTLKQTIRRKFSGASFKKSRNFQEARENVERIQYFIDNFIDVAYECNQRQSDHMSSFLREYGDVLSTIPPEAEYEDVKIHPTVNWSSTSDSFCNSDCSTDVDIFQSDNEYERDFLTQRILSSDGSFGPTFVSPFLHDSDAVFSWETMNLPEERPKCMLYARGAESPVTRSRTKKQHDKRSSPRAARAQRSVRKRLPDDEFEDFFTESDADDSKTRRNKKQSTMPVVVESPTNAQNANGTNGSTDITGPKTLIPMGPLPIGVYFDASRKLWRCQWRENGKFKTKGFSLSHYKTLADARHACILYRCEIGNMPVQQKWLNPEFVQVGTLPQKKGLEKSE